MPIAADPDPILCRRHRLARRRLPDRPDRPGGRSRPWTKLLLLVLVFLFVAPDTAEAARRKRRKGKTPAAQKSGKRKSVSRKPGPPRPLESPTPAADASDAEPSEEEEEQPRATAKPAKRRPPAQTEVDADEEQQDGDDDERDAEADGESDSAADTKVAASRPLRQPAFRASVAFGALYRRAVWVGDESDMLETYSLSPGTQLGLRFESYPGAMVGTGLAANIGAIFAFNRSVAVKSQTPDGATVNTIFQDYFIGLKWRFPLGAFVPHVSAAYAGQSFVLSPGVVGIPNVSYTSARLAVGARLFITQSFDIEAEAAYLAVIDTGKRIGYVGGTDYFPGARANGIDASGSIGLRLTRIIGLRAGVAFRHIAIDTTQATGGTLMLMARGAVDRSIVPWAALELTLDGVAPLRSISD